ncbi:MAG: YdeI/OmpD-associated family protein [Desulfosarcinaceae bacterium]|nr:YdeI/OmpD-associated family protein [Desulfosarcinaceae bacterium]
MQPEAERILIESVAQLRRWLGDHHAQRQSVWIVTWKKGAGRPYVGYDDIVDQCLCFGWVDSLRRKVDDARTMLRISPRNPKSNWSRANKRRVARLTRDGLMRPSGSRMVALAKRRGTWNFLDDVEKLEVPEDLRAEFGKYPHAARYFNAFPPSSRRGILGWIKSAKTDATRRKRIVETARQAERNIKANYPEGRNKGPAAHP